MKGGRASVLKELGTGGGRGAQNQKDGTEGGSAASENTELGFKLLLESLQLN